MSDSNLSENTYTKLVNEHELDLMLKLYGCSNVAQIVDWRAHPVQPNSFYMTMRNHGLSLMPHLSSNGNYTHCVNMRPIYEKEKHKFQLHLGNAIYALWMKGYMHEDMYPRNITWNGKEFTLIDFGKMRALTEEEKNDGLFIHRVLRKLVERFERPSVWQL